MERNSQSGQVLIEFVYFCIFAVILLSSLHLMIQEARTRAQTSRFQTQERQP